MILSRKVMVPIALTGLLVISEGQAVEVDYELRAGGFYSDNIRRAGSGSSDDLVAFVGFGLDLQQVSRRIDLSILANLDYQHYLDNTFDGEVVGALNGNLTFGISPGVLDWVTTNRFGTLNTNPLLPDTGGNRENINNFSTGPELSLKLGGVTSLKAGAHYRNNNFEVRETDNDVLGGDIGLHRALSPNRSISLTATVDDVEYDNQLLNQNFERRAVFVGFNSEISRGRVSLSLGSNEVDTGSMTADGTLASISVTRRLSPRTEFRLSYDQRFSDAGDIFRRFENPGREFDETQDIGGLGAPFESRRFSVQVDMQRGNNEFFAAVHFNDEDYESIDFLDRKRTEGNFGVARQINREWRASADVRLRLTKYRNLDRSDDDLQLGLSAARRISRDFYLDFGYRLFNRNSSGVSTDYTDNRLFVTLRFDPE